MVKLKSFREKHHRGSKKRKSELRGEPWGCRGLRLPGAVGILVHTVIVQLAARRRDLSAIPEATAPLEDR